MLGCLIGLVYDTHTVDIRLHSGYILTTIDPIPCILPHDNNLKWMDPLLIKKAVIDTVHAGPRDDGKLERRESKGLYII